MKVGIINVTGYAGSDLARILANHPEVEICSVTGRSGAGRPLGSVFPHLSSLDLEITRELEGSLDFVFSALPHAASAEALSEIVASGIKCVDISADFRLHDKDVYATWYELEHPNPELLEDSVYGLPELHRPDIGNGKLTANPGCYPTASILGLAPALKEGIIEHSVIVDAKSGVSGAGRGLSIKTHYSEVNESVTAYGLDGHRHHPEISQELDALADAHVELTFVPHLIPMTRGILATSYAKLSSDFASSNDNLQSTVQELYREFYLNEPFTRVVESAPATKQTLGNNDCLVFPTVNTENMMLTVVSCIDNLVKGAAGQAVHNMNLMCDIPETSGLEQLAVYP
tara:strand:- start:306 stop:1337 length:1032 start_codon:yes stop_codon:yes gene_type:complete